MKLMKIVKGSRTEKILRILHSEGPKTRGELAKAMGIEPIVYEYDIEKLRQEKNNGTRKSPPRNNIKVYPFLPGTLGYMSKMEYKSKFTGTKEEFLKYYKPLIISNKGKWEITDYGIMALGVLESKEIVDE